jgi:ferredoxin-thioredoxin reductase catalytic subunit
LERGGGGRTFPQKGLPPIETYRITHKSIALKVIPCGGGRAMKVTLNPDKEVVARIKEGLKMKDGYCPCRLARTPENKCMCKEFRDQIADPEFEGFCHCMLYYKSLDDEKTPQNGGSI